MSTRDKIYIDKSVNDIYEQLTNQTGSEPTTPFRYDRDVFLAAAVIGCQKTGPKELKNRKDKFGWGTLINDKNALPTLRTLALHKTRDPSILLDDDAVASIAEEYANGGIHYLKNEILNSGGTELLDCAVYILQNADSEDNE